MKKTKVNSQLLKLYQQMGNIASNEVERLARKCLAQNPKKVSEFCMAMGMFSFSDLNGKTLWDHQCEKLSGYKALNDFVMEWDSELKITGEPMRVTATGIKITDW